MEGTAIMNDPDTMSDERFAEIKDHLAGLQKELEEATEKLADALEVGNTDYANDLRENIAGIKEYFANFERDLQEALHEAVASSEFAIIGYPNHVEVPYAYCCAEGGGYVSGCACDNKDHGTAWVDVKAARAYQGNES
jgi:hypothetical protein